MDEDNGVQTEYWTCRQKRVKKPPKRPETAGKGLRNRPKKSLTFFGKFTRSEIYDSPSTNQTQTSMNPAR